MTGRRVSLSSRLTQLLAGVAVITVLIAGLVFWPLINRVADSSARQSLGRTADLVAETLNASQGSSGFSGSLSSRLELLLQQQQAYGYLVGSGAPGKGPVTPADIAAVTSGQALSVKRWSDGEFNYIEGRPVFDGAGVLLVQPAKVASDVARGTIMRLGLAMLLGIAVAVVIGSIVARRLTRPLVGAADAARAMTSGQRDIRVDPAGPAEVADIAVALNQLAEGLADSEGRQREFFLTVSHELRTPLTSLKGYSEALADGVVGPDELPAVANIMRSEADQLDRRVADLLDLARLGAMDVRVEPVPTDLSGLGHDAAATWSGRAERVGVRFSAEIAADPAWSLTDPIRVRQIIDNLMENALRVCPAGAPVIMAVTPDPQRGVVVVQVRDGGPGLTPADLAVAFEPGELHARYRGVRKVGSGVGLALVNRLAQRLGGVAHAGTAPEGGACFTVELPLLAPQPQPAGDVPAGGGESRSGAHPAG